MENITEEPPQAITRRHLFEFLRNENLLQNATSPQVIRRLSTFMKTKIDTKNFDEQILTTKIKYISCNLLSRWKITHRNLKRFNQRYSKWLDGNITFPSDIQLSKARTSGKTIGRPKTDFPSSSLKTKRRKIVNLMKSCCPAELAFAAQAGYRTIGKRNVASVIDKATSRSPKSVKRMKHVFRSHKTDTIISYTPQEALALIVDLKLTRHQYITLQKGAKERNSNLYPPYYLVLKAKEECYPNKDFINITDVLGEVKLQPLLDHTVKRLATVQEEVITEAIASCESRLLQMTYKWGCDGSSGHSLYKQSFSDENKDCVDSDVLLTSIVPLQLYFKETNTIIWQNPRTSSTKFCRPIRFQFIKESPEKLREEFLHIENQISNLIPTRVCVNGVDVFINHELLKTMVDGKVCNALMDNRSAQLCYICGASPKQMNDLEKVVKRECRGDAFNFGLSTLHAHIRFFECLLHISYRLELHKWQVRGNVAEKNRYELRRQQIIHKFRTEMGLLVDVVKQGCGTTNDGNTARRFFENPTKASEITGVNANLITRFSVILQTISCGYSLNVDAFREYAFETAKLFVNLYGWFYMPSSVHKILIHGADVIKTMILPIGQLSEDVQEARHKEYRKFREHHTRKISREKANEDLLHILLVSSDPCISSIRKLPQKNTKIMSTDVLSLLAEVAPPIAIEQLEYSDVED